MTSEVMVEIPDYKVVKLFKVAQEFKLTTETIIKHLEENGFELPRKANNDVTQEMYVCLLKKFDQPKLLLLQQSKSSADKSSKVQEVNLREEGLQEVIGIGAETAKPQETVAPKTESKKLQLPEVKPFTLIAAAEKKKVPDEPTDKPAPTPEPVAPVVETVEAVETPEIAEVEEVKPAKVEKVPEVAVESIPEAPVKRVKLELPKQYQMRIISEAKPPEPKVVPQPKVETPEPVKPAAVIKPESKQEQQSVRIIPKAKKPKQFVRKQPPVVDKFDKVITNLETQTKKTPPKDTSRPKIETPEEFIEIIITEKDGKAKPHKAKDAAAVSSKDKKWQTEKRGDKSKGKDDGGGGGGGKKGKKAAKISKADVMTSIRETQSKMEGSRRSKKRYASTSEVDDMPIVEEVLKVTEFITTNELAQQLEVSVSEIIQTSLKLGMKITINQRLDRDHIQILASEFGCDITFVQDDELEEAIEEEVAENMRPRPPVVTIMGHVDHGKTTLLDHLRRTKVAESEAGGITQHIGAYEVVYNNQRITFLDTPGHEAFTAMRARGAQITDLVVLVVAADDKVMPQTLEAIDHAKAANTPIIVAINKIDKFNADVNAIYKQLSEHNILVERWGGKYQSAEISAKTGLGIDDLLQEILIANEMMELKADPTGKARGIVVESRVDKGLGVVATVLVQSGTLRIGDYFVAGQHSGKIKILNDERGNPKESAGPSTPVQLVGFNGVPQAGDKLTAAESAEEAKTISLKRQRQFREMSMHKIRALSLDAVNRKMREAERLELPLVIKGDVHGSIEALSDSLMKLSNTELNVQIIHKSVGAITESDVLLASASDAIIIGFHVHPNLQAKELARKLGVEIRLYKILYDVVSNIQNALEGMLAPLQEEHVIGNVEIRKIYKTSKFGNIAGCYVTSGKILRNSKVRLIRDGVELWAGNVGNLKRFKDDAKEVLAGFECGLTLDGYRDVREGDQVQVFEIIETARKLESVS